MNKKIIAYVLIGVGVIVAAYYLLKRPASKVATLGEGLPDNRGAWAAEDDALYKKFESMFSVSDLNWLQPYVKQAYEKSAYGNAGDTSVSCGDDVKIAGKTSKAGSFACVVYGVAPNPDGKYPPLHWAPNVNSLWPHEVIGQIFDDLSVLKVKYGGL